MQSHEEKRASLIECDLNQHRLNRFKERFPRAETFCGAVLDPAFERFMDEVGAVDLVQMGFVLHDHTERDKPLLLKAARRFLAAGGHIIFDTLAIYRRRFEEAGFSDIEVRERYNTICVVRAKASY
jgi:hypothetical protein